jgi:ribose transport system substrate-binding protein
MKHLRVVISLPNQNSYHQEQARTAQEIARDLNVELQILQAGDDPIQQSQQILEIVQSRDKRPDAILFEPLTSTGLVRVGEAAVAAGIGWVVLNSDVDYLDRLRAQSKVPVFSVTRDHTEIGRMQGQQFGALLPNGGTVLYIQGPATSSAASQRVLGLDMTKPANIKIKALKSQWAEADAQKVVSTWLQLSTSRATAINLVGCQYDGIAMGARKAFQAHTDKTEREHWLSLPFTGVDGLPLEGQAWVNKGILAATVVAPSTTPIAIRMLVRALESGAQPPERTFLEMKSYPSLDELRKKASQYATKK